MFMNVKRYVMVYIQMDTFVSNFLRVLRGKFCKERRALVIFRFFIVADGNEGFLYNFRFLFRFYRFRIGPRAIRCIFAKMRIRSALCNTQRFARDRCLIFRQLINRGFLFHLFDRETWCVRGRLFMFKRHCTRLVILFRGFDNFHLFIVLPMERRFVGIDMRPYSQDGWSPMVLCRVLASFVVRMSAQVR